MQFLNACNVLRSVALYSTLDLAGKRTVGIAHDHTTIGSSPPPLRACGRPSKRLVHKPVLEQET